MKSTFFSISALVIALPLCAAENKQDDTEWVEAMKKVHEGFSGNKGYVLQLGDSITYSMAFWAALQWKDPAPFIKDDGLPKQPEGKRWRDVIKGFRDKGTKHGNYSGWRIGNLLKAVGGQLAKKKPEVAIIMIGTNDVRDNKVPEGYAKGLETVLTRCMKAGCVPILSTIPPMRDRKEGVDGANRIIRALAEKHRVPLVDYHAAIIKRRPKDWDGSLISKDGVHPSGGKHEGWGPDVLRSHGYALRNWVTFMVFRKVYFRVLKG